MAGRRGTTLLPIAPSGCTLYGWHRARIGTRRSSCSAIRRQDEKRAPQSCRQQSRRERILSVAEDLTVLNPLMIARCGLRSRHIAILAWDRADRRAPQKAE